MKTRMITVFMVAAFLVIPASICLGGDPQPGGGGAASVFKPVPGQAIFTPSGLSDQTQKIFPVKFMADHFTVQVNSNHEAMCESFIMCACIGESSCDSTRTLALFVSPETKHGDQLCQMMLMVAAMPDTYVAGECQLTEGVECRALKLYIVKGNVYDQCMAKSQSQGTP